MVVKNSSALSKTPFNANLFYKWQNGTLTPSYDRIVDDIFPALHIDSLQKMIVFLASFSQDELGLDSITVIKKNEHSHDNRLGLSILFAEEGRVNPHPVRIDRVAVKLKGGGSVVTSHHGYNYLLVISGRVSCSFWSNQEKARAKPNAPQQKILLQVGDAIAFPTRLPHKIDSVTRSSNVVIARPPWGRPDPLV